MKGVLFSADFAIDENNDPRLLELNTDTSIYASFTSSINWTNLTDVINNNSEIKEFHLIHKPTIHSRVEPLISKSIAANCTNIDTYSTTEVDHESSYPTSPVDSGSRFILRLAYDENAVFDSTYCKNNVNTLKLMYDNDATSSITEFYHSSSTAEVNNLSGNIGSNNNLPNFVLKSVDPNVAVHKFLSITGSVTDTSAIAALATGSSDTTNYVERFYYSSDQVSNNKLRALRSYNILYGTDLEIIKLGSGSFDAIFNFQTGSNFRELPNNVNTLHKKHYYEFTNKFPHSYSTNNHGFLGEELIAKPDGSYITGSLIQSGSDVKSYFYSGSPDSDNMEVVDAWSITGFQTPSGSFERSASVVTHTSSSIDTNGFTQIELSGFSDYLNLGNNTRIMVYSTSSNLTKYVHANKIDPTDHYVVNIASSSVVPVTNTFFTVLNNDLELHSLDVEPDDAFFLKVGDHPLGIQVNIHNYSEDK